MRANFLRLTLLSFSLLAFVPTPGLAQITPATQSAPLRTEEIDQLLAPVALYPDSLLAQILMASTYPFEVAQASQFVKANPSLTGQRLQTAVSTRDWDASVKALTDTPQVLQMMSDRLDWMQKLGDTYLAQQSAVADSVQRLRKRASDSGQLKSTGQQQVVTENQTIVIQQADPNVVYVPTYDPAYVYGSWPYPDYPPYPYYPYPGYGLAAAGIGFIAGAAISNWWNNPHVDWHGGNINIDNNFNRNGNFNRNNIGNGNRTWQHDPAHRKGTNYRDASTRQRFGKSDGLANARQDFRGRNPGQTAGFQNQLANRAQVGGLQNQIGRGQLGQSAIAANRGASVADRRGSASGFDGVGRGGQTRVDSNRGLQSRTSAGFQGNRTAQNRSYGGARSSAGFSGARGGGGGFRGGGGGFRGGGGGGRR